MSSQNDYQSNGRYDNIYSQIDSEAKMSFSVDVLANIAIELQRGIGHQDRFQRLITTLRQVLECDASALLRYDSRQFIPLAIDGLAKDVLGRRFALEGHPRLEAIARAGDVVRFPADSELPDPYDGLIPGQESLKVHACVGLPLFAGQNLIGALTLDGMQPDQFDVFSDEELLRSQCYKRRGSTRSHSEHGS